MTVQINPHTTLPPPIRRKASRASARAPLTRMRRPLYFARTQEMNCRIRATPDSDRQRRLTTFGIALACLAILLSPSQPTVAAPKAVARSCWQTHAAPTHEDLVLLPGSDILNFDIAGPDGLTIYAIGTWNAPPGCVDNDYADDNIAAGQSPVLWKSSNAGITWHDVTENVLQAQWLPDCLDDGAEWSDMVFFSAVAAAPDDSNFVIVCGYDATGIPVVVGSRDGGRTFYYTGCSDLRGEILCADVSPSTPEGRSIAVGTVDLANGGSIWQIEPGRQWSARWEDTGTLPGWAEAWLDMSGTMTRRDVYAVTSVAFSPSYATDHAITAVLIAFAEESDGDTYDGYYLATGRWDETPGWNGAAGFDAFPVSVGTKEGVIQTAATLPAFFLRHISDLALPYDFEADSRDAARLLLAVNGAEVDQASGNVTGEGGFLFRLDGARLSRDLLRDAGNPWLASIDYAGDRSLEGTVIAGCFLPESLSDAWRWSPHIQDWFADNGDRSDGDHVLPCCEGVMVLYAEGLDECCPSWTTAALPPSGQFNCQVAFAPDGSRAYATTAGDSRHGLKDYRWGDESAFSISITPGRDAPWLQTGLIDTTITRIVDLNYAPATGCLYLHTQHDASPGRICACESIWRSCDQGRSFVRMLHGQPDRSEADEDEFDAVMEKYQRGFTTPTTTGYLYGAGVRYIIGDAIDADEEDQVEAGFEADAVYRMVEGGAWKRISELTLNYAGLLLMDGASGTVLYVGFDNLWWDFSDNLPLPYRPDGSDPACPYGHKCRKTSGVARCLLPDADACCSEPEWDYLIRGLEGSAETDAVYEHLGFSGASRGEGAIRLWSIDKENRYWSEEGSDSDNYDYCGQEFINPLWGRLWTYDDCPAATTITVENSQPMIPTDPCFCVNEEFVLQWERPCDICEYEIQVALDAAFATVVLDTHDFAVDDTAGTGGRFYLPPDPAHPSLIVNHGQIDCNSRYWWRVRAHCAETDEIIAGWWSAPAAFRTAPSPAHPLTPTTPCDGATRVPTQNVAFTWSSIAGASTYDFMLIDVEHNHVASKIGPQTSFVLPGPLHPGASYLWRVLALDGDQVIAESDRVTFTTEPPTPAPVEYVPALITPPAAPCTADWVAPFVGAIALLLLFALAALSYVNRLQRRRRR